MKTLDELLNTLYNLNIGDVIRKSQYDDYDDLSGLEIDYKTQSSYCFLMNCEIL